MTGTAVTETGSAPGVDELPPVAPGDGGAGGDDDGPQGPPPEIAQGRRRFTVAVVVAQLVAAVPFLWVLWGVWESTEPLRKTAYEANFYELQARAMFHGHLWLTKGSIGIEAFTHDGHQYTYFGLFPSILRMPVLLLTSSLDGRMTPTSMGLAWVVTGLMSSLLLWRVRVLLRGEAPMGRGEAVSYGVLMATVMVGSVLVYLAATPYVFDEDLAWSVALTVGCLFMLLGVLERPSVGRVVGSGLFMLAANLDRLTTGWACVVAGVLIAAWFGLGRGGDDRRRWWLPVAAVSLGCLAAGCVVNWLKFGAPFGLPVEDQVFTMVNAYRRRFLAANHGSEEGIAFAPSDALAYLRPDGLRVTSTFPFVGLPARPPAALAGTLFDRRYRTASVETSMPLLFLLACWGTITTYRPRALGRIALVRIPLFAAAAAGAALLLWGYISERYLADFVPFLVVGAAVGMADLWRRCEGRTPRFRRWTVAVIAVAGLFSVVANLGIAVTPTDEWDQAQTDHYVEAQRTVSDVTGHPLEAQVVHVSSLPEVAPAGQLAVVGACDGFYLANGEDYRTVPTQAYQRTNWLVVERGPAFQHTLALHLADRVTPGAAPVPLVTVGRSTVSARLVPARDHQVQVTYLLTDPTYGGPSFPITVPAGSTLVTEVVADPADHTATVTADGFVLFNGPMTGGSPIVVHTGVGPTGAGGSPPAATVTDLTHPGSPPICHSLTGR